MDFVATRISVCNFRSQTCGVRLAHQGLASPSAHIRASAGLGDEAQSISREQTVFVRSATAIAGSVRVRSRVKVPLELESGLLVDSDVLSFHGLSDGREHLAIALGDAGGG